MSESVRLRVQEAEVKMMCFNQQPTKRSLATPARWAGVAAIVCLCAPANADDHGSEPSQATPLALGMQVAGSIEQGNDKDLFRLSLGAATQFAVYTTGSLDTVGALYYLDYSRKVIEDDDSGSGLNFRFTVSVPAGDYYVLVESYGEGTGSYTLHAERAGDGSSDDDDHGNTVQTASRVAIGAATSGRIEQSGDVDYFRLESDGLQHIEILTTGGTDTYGHLLQPRGTRVITVAQDDNDGASRNFRIEARVPSGTYYVRVEGRGQNRGGYGLETRAAYVASRIGPQVNEGRTGGRDIEVGSVFRDCPKCPLMTVIPGGRFRMGRPLSEPGNPDLPNADLPLVTSVRIGGRAQVPLAIGAYEVTYGEWLACREENGCSSPGHGHTGGHDYPVARLTVNDMEEYVGWLSRRTGKRYRLPSEAEWEYAARAGTQTMFAFGASINRLWAKFGQRETVPAGSFPPNAFGLFDIHGNVWEVTADCWTGSLEGTRWDGGSKPGGDCKAVVKRGGGYFSAWDRVRSASRYFYKATSRETQTGFRVVREVRVR